jgi:hypothetical protein
MAAGNRTGQERATMGFFKDLFSRGMDTKALKVKLKQVERERRKSDLEMRKLSARQDLLLNDIKEGRKTGNSLKVDHSWEELKNLKYELAFIRRAAKVSSLEHITLKRYVYGIERMERAKDRDGIQRIIQKMQNSGLEAKLQVQQVNEEAYMDELNAVLEDAGTEDSFSDSGQFDEDKQRLMDEIDALNKAEDSNDFDMASKRQMEIKKLLEKEEPSN